LSRSFLFKLLLYFVGDYMTMKRFFSENPSLALCFSGGVDSTYLLYAALQHGADVHAYFVKTAFQPAFELEDARHIAKQLGAKMTVLSLNILEQSTIVANPPDRCYFCKKVILSAIAAQAAADGYSLLADGTNASDDTSDRPGMRALSELSVRSPLRECGITKDKVRLLSKEAGLFTHNKPAYACLATRIPAGAPITPDMLNKVEQSEAALHGLGFSDLRIRIFNNAAKLQLPTGQMINALEKRKAILRELKPYFPEVLLDMNGR
jgi:uncharacterized protein